MELPHTLKLVDFDHYGIHKAVSNINSIDSAFRSQGWPLFRGSLSREPQLDLIARHPWLRSLAVTSGSLDEIVVMLNEGYNQPTLLMMELDVLSSNHYVAITVKSRLSTKLTAENTKTFLTKEDFGQIFAPDGQKIFRLIVDVLHATMTSDPLETDSPVALNGGAVDSISVLTHEPRQARAYRVVFAKRLEQLCLTVGVPEISVNPRANIIALRKFFSTRSQTSMGREGALQLQVDNLTERTRWQGRVITNLMYRQLMQNLPETRASTNESARQCWLSFLEQAVDMAQQEQSAAHPLANIVSSTSSDYQQVLQTGQQLYDSIETNIRASNIEYRPANDQWDAAPLALLQALRPVSYLSNGEVHWAAERQRFLSPSTTADLSTRERPTVGSAGIPISPITEAARPPPYSSVTGS
jgi:hypothetical protein